MRLPEWANKSITKKRGFTLMELMVAVSIVAILATIAMPSFLAQRQRNDVAKAIRMADGIRDDVTDYYNKKLAFPADNSETGVPEPEFLIGNKVTSIQVEDGAIHITLGNKASNPLHGKIISMRPAVVTGSPASPISWLCGFDEAVTGMEAVGKNKTDIDNGLVPSSCGSQKSN